MEESKRLVIETEIDRRIRGGEEQMAWLTIPNAMIELDALVSELKPELCGSLKAYREKLPARLVLAE